MGKIGYHEIYLLTYIGNINTHFAKRSTSKCAQRDHFLEAGIRELHSTVCPFLNGLYQSSPHSSTNSLNASSSDQFIPLPAIIPCTTPFRVLHCLRALAASSFAAISRSFVVMFSEISFSIDSCFSRSANDLFEFVRDVSLVEERLWDSWRVESWDVKWIRVVARRSRFVRRGKRSVSIFVRLGPE